MIEIRVDRDMEYVHLKDMRAAGFEPENVLSRYKWQEGLGYYESTGDAATNFFIDWLPKGTYVFEYPMRAQLKGQFLERYYRHAMYVCPRICQPQRRHKA
jgi:hypothetical protein